MRNLKPISNPPLFFRRVIPAILCLYLGPATSLWAQLQVVPLEAGISAQSTHLTKSARIQAIELPFFDDFSTATSTHPDPQLWQPGSGIYINNTLTTTHPSINVATFDGLDASGAQYNLKNKPPNEQDQGGSDTLVSQPINLGGLKPADSLYISYYWQAKGLGELPDRADTLRLEFLGKTGNWITVWKQPGGSFDSLFRQTFIPIVDTTYLHDTFQFRFRAYGRLSGAFDTWHLDYIYLNKGRSLNDRFIKDIAVRPPLTSLLRQYRAMPFKHYFANSAAAMADSVRTDIVNLFNNFNFTSYTFTIFDEVGKREVQRYQQPVSAIIGAQQTQIKNVAIQPLARPAQGTRMRLRYKFALLTTDDQNPTIPTVNLRRNDTISAYTDLADYYAYDDGSAEFGVRMNQRLGRTAVRFVSNQPDTLGGVRMALVPFRKNISGQGFTIQVYSNRNGKPDRVLYQKSVAVKYGENRNDFVEYEFNNGVAVVDTFYVGWLQISEDALAVGFDRNSPLGTSQLVSSLSTEWTNNTEIQGSVMIRPFFGGKTSGIITGSEPLSTLALSIFPNPTSGLIHWKSESIRQIEVFSLQGINVRTIFPVEGQREASLAELSEGLYVLRISDGLRTVTQKILFTK